MEWLSLRELVLPLKDHHFLPKCLWALSNASSGFARKLEWVWSSVVFRTCPFGKWWWYLLVPVLPDPLPFTPVSLRCLQVALRLGACRLQAQPKHGSGHTPRLRWSHMGLNCCLLLLLGPHGPFPSGILGREMNPEEMKAQWKPSTSQPCSTCEPLAQEGTAIEIAVPGCLPVNPHVGFFDSVFKSSEGFLVWASWNMLISLLRRSD